MRKRDFFHTGLNVSRSDLAGMPFSPYGKNPTGADDFYCDGNALISEDGTSFDSPTNSLQEAIALSNASMARNRYFARRNRIFFCADDMDEDLTILPQKCDIIGLGSRNAGMKAGIVGTHEPTTGSGCRFFNVHFLGIAAAAPIWTLDLTVAGFEFYGCTFDGSPGTVTSGILATASTLLEVHGCEFWGAFATSAISIGAGNMVQFHICNNEIGGTPAFVPAAGIIVDILATAGYGAFITDNNIRCTGLIIDDNADICRITGNRGFSDVAVGTDATLVEYINGNVALGADNKISGGTLANADWPVVDIVAAS